MDIVPGYTTMITLTSQSLAVFFYLPAWLKPPSGLTSKFFPIRSLSKFFSNRRFSQISIIFGSVGGGKSLNSPLPPTFRAKKAL